MNNLPEEREQRDEQIAELLQDGLTVEEIKRRLQTSYRAVARVRGQRGIAVPAGRTRRSRDELDDLEEQAVAMLRAGATQREIYAKLRVGPITQTRLRKEHRIPVQPHRGRKTPLAGEGGPSQGELDAARGPEARLAALPRLGGTVGRGQGND